jgi:hypothetical protein
MSESDDQTDHGRGHDSSQQQSDAEGYVNRFELAIRADLEVIKAQPSRDEESQ